MTAQNLKLRVKTAIPARLFGANGVTVTKENGIFTIGPTTGVFGNIIGPEDGSDVLGKVAVFLDEHNIGPANFDSADVEAIKGAGEGLIVKTSDADPQEYTARTLTGTAGEITVTNGDGASGNPTFSLPSTINLTGKTLTSPTISAPAITGVADIQNSLSLSGDLTPSQITSNQNNYAPTGIGNYSVLRLSSDADRQITGITAGADGRILYLLNVGSYVVLLKNDSSSSTAGNRFSFGDDAPIYPNRAVTLIYDGTSSRWRILEGHAKRNIIDFRDYGLKGDGSTADTAAFSRLVTTESANVVLDGAGRTYVIDGLVTMVAGNFQKIRNATFTVSGDVSFLTQTLGYSYFREFQDIYITASGQTTFGRYLIDFSRMNNTLFKRIWTDSTITKTIQFLCNGDIAGVAPYYNTFDEIYSGNYFNFLRAEGNATPAMAPNSNHVIGGRSNPGSGNTAIYLGQNTQNWDVQTISIEDIAGGTGIYLDGDGHTVGRGVRFEGLTKAVDVQDTATHWEISSRYYDSNAANIVASATARRNGLITYDPDRSSAFSAPKAIYGGVGGGTGEMIVSGRIDTNTTGASNSGTGETDLMSYTLPADSLNATGQVLRITVSGTVANSANAKTIKLYFGGTAIATLSPPTGSTNVFRIVADVIASGANAQKYTTIGHLNASATPSSGSLTVTTNATAIIKVTGQGGASTEVTFVSSVIEFV